MATEEEYDDVVGSGHRIQAVHRRTRGGYRRPLIEQLDRLDSRVAVVELRDGLCITGRQSQVIFCARVIGYTD